MNKNQLMRLSQRLNNVIDSANYVCFSPLTNTGHALNGNEELISDLKKIVEFNLSREKGGIKK